MRSLVDENPFLSGSNVDDELCELPSSKRRASSIKTALRFSRKLPPRNNSSSCTNLPVPDARTTFSMHDYESELSLYFLDDSDVSLPMAKIVSEIDSDELSWLAHQADNRKQLTCSTDQTISLKVDSIMMKSQSSSRKATKKLRRSLSKGVLLPFRSLLPSCIWEPNIHSASQCQLMAR